jgi:PhoH-like ATPase
MKKTFVVDTNVILHSHQALFSFKDNDVVVPLGVIEELDRFKGFNDERGREARQASRELDNLREKGTLAQGVPLPNGGSLQIMIDSETEIPYGFGLDTHKVDNRILACAMTLKKQGRNVVLISKDINCRIKADALGINTEDFETNKIDIDELYTGWRELVLPVSRIETFLREEASNTKTTFSRMSSFCSRQPKTKTRQLWPSMTAKKRDSCRFSILTRARGE